MKKREKRRNLYHLSCFSAAKRLALNMISIPGNRSHSNSKFSHFLFIAVIFGSFLSPVFSVTPKETPKNNYTFFEEKNSDLYFSHLTVNTYTGQVYVGGVNRIYQLSPHLTQEAIAIMGPEEDSSDCSVTKNCPSVVKKPTIYYNKVLVIDYAQSRLITCGSLFQGVCSTHKLDNVSSYETPASESVVANNATASTVAFIAPGPQKSPKHVLYVGVSYTANGPYRSDVPAVSSRSLDPNGLQFK
jgi:plexin A